MFQNFSNEVAMKNHLQLILNTAGKLECSNCSRKYRQVRLYVEHVKECKEKVRRNSLMYKIPRFTDFQMAKHPQRKCSL